MAPSYSRRRAAFRVPESHADRPKG